MMPLPEARRLGLGDALAALLLVAAVAYGASQRMVPGVVGVFHDDAVYAITAEALAEGDGYRLRNLPGAPPQTKYPILYPALLAAASLGAATPHDRLVVMQGTTAACGALALAAVYLFLVRFGIASRGAAFFAGLLAASSPLVLFYCAQPLSEMPFLLLVALALWSAESRLRADRGSPALDFAAGLAVATPMLCRSVGVAVALAALLVLALRGRPLRAVVAGVLVGGLPWWLWSLSGSGATADAAVSYQTDYWGWWMQHGSATVVLRNIYDGGIAFCHIGLEALSRFLYERTDHARLLLFVAGSLPWIIVLRRGLGVTILPVTLLLYLALVLVWPWPPDRFLIPLFPFLAALLFDAVVAASARLGLPRLPAGLAAVALLPVLFANAGMVSRYAEASRASSYPYFLLTDSRVDWSSYRRAFDWLREHSAEGEVLAAGFDTMTALYTGRATIRPFAVRPLSLYYGEPGPAVGTVAEFADLLAAHRARFLFVSPMPAYAEEEPFADLVSEALQTRRGLLRLVWQEDEGRFLIFETALPPR
jgi:hypothetical protein